MIRTLLTILLPALFLFACSSPSENAATETTETTAHSAVADNPELQAMYDADQAGRQVPDIDWSVLSVEDEKRRQRVYEMLDSNLVRTSKDYKNAAMIFQHGGDTIASQLTIELMKKAIELNPERSKWLLAAAIDRDLMRRGKPQIYGTQYIKDNQEDDWGLYDLDSTQVSDEERREYGVETLAEQRAKVKQLNLHALHELLSEGTSIDDIIAMIEKKDARLEDYDHSESGINSFGYTLMQMEQIEEALKVFEMNTKLFPEAYNTHDSYGECLMAMGRTEEGLAAYQRSLDLNPKNETAKKVLEEHAK